MLSRRSRTEQGKRHAISLTSGLKTTRSQWGKNRTKQKRTHGCRGRAAGREGAGGTASSLPDLLSDSVTAGRRGRHTGNQGRQSGRRVRGQTRGPDRPRTARLSSAPRLDSEGAESIRLRRRLFQNVSRRGRRETETPSTIILILETVLRRNFLKKLKLFP